MKGEILGIGAPILDHLLHVSYDYLNSIPGENFGMEFVEYQEMVHIIEKSGSIPKQVLGGSCGNVIKGLAALGHDCSLAGKIGKDPIGEKVIEGLQDQKVTPRFAFSKTPTAHVACLITPDGKRTMRTFPGASLEMRPEDLVPEMFHGKKLVHIEGYSIECPGLTERAMHLAKEAGACVSFDLGSFELVEMYVDELLYLLSTYVDIVFANQEETHALVKNGPEKGCRVLSKLCNVACVMLAEKGCLLGNKQEVIPIPTTPIVPVDTTGAGDLFASGFLHGFIIGKPLKTCAEYGCIVGGSVVEVVGAELSPEHWALIKEKLAKKS